MVEFRASPKVFADSDQFGHISKRSCKGRHHVDFTLSTGLFTLWEFLPQERQKTEPLTHLALLKACAKCVLVHLTGGKRNFSKVLVTSCLSYETLLVRWPLVRLPFGERIWRTVCCKRTGGKSNCNFSSLWQEVVTRLLLYICFFYAKM